MGDPRRFILFAELIARYWPERTTRIADVAAGRGKLKGELYRRGYEHVTAWDLRRKLAKRRPGQVFQLFDHRSARRGYELVVGMHPDGATDQIILYAVKHRVPFAVCPCCILPTGAPYAGPQAFDDWCRHLAGLASAFRTQRLELPMRGRNVVLVGLPSQAGGSARA